MFSNCKGSAGDVCMFLPVEVLAVSHHAVKFATAKSS